MPITGPQARAARALVEWPRDHVARLAGLVPGALADFEYSRLDLDPEAKQRLVSALESGGAVFIEEDEAGVGVRLKFRRGDARSINRLENEGGPVGDDDVA
ncbi:MAG: DNA-binding protein [Brevundimonas sp.]|uniref:DNA-binding protein n=1 Tax=Brevundimonas sp. TaxID=1871086 RepID=UPI0025C5FAE7|nr:DNA-binding protein [Brevundimonas sp.]MBX3478163.1 DNA-binding protein [Brevundimonas sp.]